LEGPSGRQLRRQVKALQSPLTLPQFVSHSFARLPRVGADTRIAYRAGTSSRVGLMPALDEEQESTRALS
jgi:hypothetical protein